MASSIVTAPMAKKAEALIGMLPTLSTGTSKLTGQHFYVVPSSNRLSAHWTAIDGSGCTCIGYQRRGLCTHAIAARTLYERQQPAVTPAPKARSSYADLFAGCRDCGDLADGLDGRCSKCAGDREWQARREQRAS